MVRVSRSASGQVRLGKGWVKAPEEGPKSDSQDHQVKFSSTNKTGTTTINIGGRQSRNPAARTPGCQSTARSTQDTSPIRAENIFAEIIVKTDQDMDIDSPSGGVPPPQQRNS